MKKKIYLVNLPDDCGELWLDEKKQPLDWVHCNDASFREEYQKFIIDYLGGELVILRLKLPEKVIDDLVEADCTQKIFELIKKYLPE